jgi:hypothetical protein
VPTKDGRSDAQAYKDLALQMRLKDTLRGKVLRDESNARDSDYSGGGWFEEKRLSIHLFADMRFRWERYVFRSIRGGGMSMPSERRDRREGTWDVRVRNDVAELILTADGEEFARWRTRDAGTGMQELNGRVWKRYQMKA